jgi:hypothetical protein
VQAAGSQAQSLAGLHSARPGIVFGAPHECRPAEHASRPNLRDGQRRAIVRFEVDHNLAALQQIDIFGRLTLFEENLVRSNPAGFDQRRKPVSLLHAQALEEARIHNFLNQHSKHISQPAGPLQVASFLFVMTIFLLAAVKMVHSQVISPLEQGMAFEYDGRQHAAHRKTIAFWRIDCQIAATCCAPHGFSPPMQIASGRSIPMPGCIWQASL